MDLFDAIYTRRSVRNYEPQPVPRDVLEKIVAAGVEAPSGCNMQLRQYIIVDDPEVMDQLRPVSNAMRGACAAIVIVVDPQPSKFGPEFWVQDASAAMENMLLATVALGYGACWVEGAVRPAEEQLRQVLSVPDHLRVWSLMPVGTPAVQPDRPAKPTAAEITHYNRFGQREG